MKLNVCIAGATGWVGKPLCLAVSAADDLILVGAVSPRHKGRNLKEALGDSDLDLTVSGSVAEALDTPTDVLVDYTKADVVKANVMTAIRKSVHVVIGSSGLTDEDFISYVISVEAIFGAKDERLVIRHEAGSGATPYIHGTLLAIRKVKNYVGLIRGLDRIME